MKKHLQREIVERGRVHDGFRKGRKAGKTSQDLDHSYWNDDRDVEAKFFRTKMFNDNLGPLFRFLESSVGRPWEKVWKEICQNNDNRSITGNHLRDHVLQYVDNDGIGKEAMYNYRSYYFKVDDHGILRRSKTYGSNFYPKYKNRKKRVDRYCLKIGNNFYLGTEYQGWFKSEGGFSEVNFQVRHNGLDPYPSLSVKLLMRKKGSVDPWYFSTLAEYYQKTKGMKAHERDVDYTLSRTACTEADYKLIKEALCKLDK